VCEAKQPSARGTYLRRSAASASRKLGQEFAQAIRIQSDLIGQRHRPRALERVLDLLDHVVHPHLSALSACSDIRLNGDSLRVIWRFSSKAVIARNTARRSARVPF
jgi:hypothetical protein